MLRERDRGYVHLFTSDEIYTSLQYSYDSHCRACYEAITLVQMEILWDRVSSFALSLHFRCTSTSRVVTPLSLPNFLADPNTLPPWKLPHFHSPSSPSQ